MTGWSVYITFDNAIFSADLILCSVLLRLLSCFSAFIGQTDINLFGNIGYAFNPTLLDSSISTRYIYTDAVVSLREVYLVLKLSLGTLVVHPGTYGGVFRQIEFTPIVRIHVGSVGFRPVGLSRKKDEPMDKQFKIPYKTTKTTVKLCSHKETGVLFIYS